MKLFGFLNLKGISGQIAALVVTSIIAIHLIITATFLIHRSDQRDPWIDRGRGQLVVAAQILGAAPAEERQRLFADIARAFPQQADLQTVSLARLGQHRRQPAHLQIRSWRRIPHAPAAPGSNSLATEQPPANDSLASLMTECDSRSPGFAS